VKAQETDHRTTDTERGSLLSSQLSDFFLKSIGHRIFLRSAKKKIQAFLIVLVSPFPELTARDVFIYDDHNRWPGSA
jgi:hypothetical protein